MKSIDHIPFNRPYMTGGEINAIVQAHANGSLAGDGPFTKHCHEWLENQFQVSKALLTHSCTAALEMAALLVDIEPGDEVIMPSYTFVSTANAFVLRGAIPVFVDIRQDTLNLNEKLIESAITPRTKVICPVHYAGVACEMDAIMAIAQKNNLLVVEDAAQGVMARYKDRPLGSIGDLGAYSFHETKNIISGEGGALLVNNPKFSPQAEIIREKGTDRSQFFRGEVDKYTWQSIGSSYLPGELTAAFLWAQLQEAQSITDKRLKLWNGYHEMLSPLEQRGIIRRPIIPKECSHNGHMYYILLSPDLDRQNLLGRLKDEQINAVFHYVPLHSSPFGKKCARLHGDLEVTKMQSDCIIRLPLWVGLSEEQQARVVDVLNDI
jgi:dTDP-4-amino-4,6-dideoxygalactose transaminase